MNLSVAPESAHRLSEALGNTLLHSLWQGAAIALLLAAFLRATKRKSADFRCRIACLAFFALPLWMAVTLSAEWSSSVPDGSPAPFEPAYHPGESAATATVRHLPEETGLGASQRISWRGAAAVAWALGAVLALVRLTAGWLRLETVRRRSKPVTDLALRRQLALVSDRLGVREKVALRFSDRIAGPLMSGFLRPVIILPAGLLGGIPAAHLQSILAHELAHFRRWDYVVNLWQSVVEALLFYHPAAWWISRQIRIEREHACDDLAASLPGNDPHRYAGALAWLELFRSRPETPHPAMAMAEDSGTTLSRIRRLGAIVPEDGDRPARNPGPGTGSAGRLFWLVPLTVLALFAPESPGGSGDGAAARPVDGALVAVPSVFARCQNGSDRVRYACQLLGERITWPRNFHEGREIFLFKSGIILERGGKLYNLHKEEPRLFPPIPNRYLLDHRLNILDGGLPNRDPDGDGFTILEEFRAGTDPRNARSHPDYADKLRFIARHALIYRVTFAARPDDTRFQLNRSPSVRWTRKTMIHRLGETTADGQLRLEKFTEAGLEVTYLPTGDTYWLPKRRGIEIPTWFAELRLDLPDEEGFYVELGQSFRLDREPGRPLRLTAVGESGARISNPETPGELRIIGTLDDPAVP